MQLLFLSVYIELNLGEILNLLMKIDLLFLFLVPRTASIMGVQMVTEESIMRSEDDDS